MALSFWSADRMRSNEKSGNHKVAGVGVSMKRSGSDEGERSCARPGNGCQPTDIFASASAINNVRLGWR
jgi:hypothetical protein